MRRRDLIRRFAAIAAAVVVAPVARVEAETRTASPWGTVYTTRQLEEIRGWVDEARAEGYERGRAVEQAKQESLGLKFEDKANSRRLWDSTVIGDGTLPRVYGYDSHRGWLNTPEEVADVSGTSSLGGIATWAQGMQTGPLMREI